MHWQIFIFDFDLYVLYCDGIKHRTDDALFRLTATKKDHAPIKYDPPESTLVPLAGSGPSTRHISNMTTTLDKGSLRVVAQVVENNDA